MGFELNTYLTFLGFFSLFQADSVEEQQRWLKDLQLVIFQCQTQGRTGTLSQRGGTRQSGSRSTTPVLHRSSTGAGSTTVTAADDEQRRPRTSSIPVGVTFSPLLSYFIPIHVKITSKIYLHVKSFFWKIIFQFQTVLFRCRVSVFRFVGPCLSFNAET